MQAKYRIGNKVIAGVLTLGMLAPVGYYVQLQERQPGWKGIGENAYYMVEGTEKRATGLTEIDDSLYYFSGTGEIQSGWQTISSDTYYFDEKGKAVTGEQTIQGHEYNFQSDGKLKHGWSEDGLQYYDEHGFIVKSQKIQDNGNTYYFDSNGVRMTGWQEIDGNTYYFSSTGEMAYDNTEIDGKKYYFNSDGRYITGWEDIDGKQVYHSTENGMILRNKAEKVEGILRYFGEDGTMVKGKNVDGYNIDEDGVATRVQTKAEREAEEAEKKRKEEEAKAKRIAEQEKKAYEEQQKQLLAQGNKYSGSIKADGSTASIIANAALSQLGRTQDCTMLVTNSLAAAGINFHDWPENYASLGSWTSNPVPGDICIYKGHVAVYIGNGQAVHGGWNGWTTRQYSVGCSNPFLGYIHVGG